MIIHWHAAPDIKLKMLNMYYCILVFISTDILIITAKWFCMVMLVVISETLVTVRYYQFCHPPLWVFSTHINFPLFNFSMLSLNAQHTIQKRKLLKLKSKYSQQVLCNPFLIDGPFFNILLFLMPDHFTCQCKMSSCEWVNL